MKQEMIISKTNSLDSICHGLTILAPNTLRTPISFVRCSATKDDRPNNPRHEISIASMAKRVDKFPIRSSSENLCAYSSSVNLYSKGLEGLYFLNTVSILDKALFIVTDGFMRTVTTFAHPGSITKITGCTGS